ncbi:ImmA/IrrE family metallo-endopeptidase [Kribbella sp. NPDC003557]|uniref:helix-turn-helix domain-containing protein n=1 Tax=Kribbella sp. NPDC003557 TaxID=3154449 RepID=UPI0033B373B0
MEAVTAAFTPERLISARKRAGISQARLASHIGISPRSIANYEGGEHAPSEEVLQRLADALDVPVSFFGAAPPDIIEPDAASFRALSKMSALKRDAALASGGLATELNDWLEARLRLPRVAVPRYARGARDPESCAQRLRLEWEMGYARVPNMVHLLEAHGARVYSLPEDLTDTDAFSFWWRDVPFILLNTRKSAERGRFDAAHELGHLVMHADYDLPRGREREFEANRFAAAFLMPEDDVLAAGLRHANAEQVIAAKSRWDVAATALAHRLHELGITSDWTYHSTFRRLSQLGYRSGEPDREGRPRETSQALEKAFALLRERGIRPVDVARELHVRPETLHQLLFGLVLTPMSGQSTARGGPRAGLRVVK